jgi:hypothetical protein
VYRFYYISEKKFQSFLGKSPQFWSKLTTIFFRLDISIHTRIDKMIRNIVNLSFLTRYRYRDQTLKSFFKVFEIFFHRS